MASANLKKRVIDLLSKGRATTGYDGLPELVTDAALVASIFQEADYTVPELDEIRTWLGQHPVTVRGDHPRSPKLLPCVIVTRTGAVPDAGGPIGDHFGADLEADTANDATFVRGVRSTEKISVKVWAYNTTSMRDALYLAVLELLLRARAYLEDDASLVDMVLFTSGRDGEIDLGDDERGKAIVIHTAEIGIDANTRTTWSNTSAKATDLTGESTYLPFQDET